jgi:hypothetical protein
MLGKFAEPQGDHPTAGKRYREFLKLWKDAVLGLPEIVDVPNRLAGSNGHCGSGRPERCPANPQVGISKHPACVLLFS